MAKKTRIAGPPSASASTGPDQGVLVQAAPTFSRLPVELSVHIFMLALQDYGLLDAIRLSRTCKKLYSVFNSLPHWRNIQTMNGIPDCKRGGVVTLAYISERLAVKQRALCGHCWIWLKTPATYVAVYPNSTLPLCSECRTALWSTNAAVRARSYKSPEYEQAFQSRSQITRTAACQWLKDPTLQSHSGIPWRRTPDRQYVAPKYWVLEAAWAWHGGQAGLVAFQQQRERLQQKLNERKVWAMTRMVRGIIDVFDPNLPITEVDTLQIQERAAGTSPTIMTYAEWIARGVIQREIGLRVIRSAFQTDSVSFSDPLLALVHKNLAYKKISISSRLNSQNVYNKTVIWSNYIDREQFTRFENFVRSNVPFVRRLLELRGQVMQSTALPRQFVETHINDIFKAHFTRYYPLEHRPSRIASDEKEFELKFNREMTVANIESILGMWHFLTLNDTWDTSKYGYVNINAVERRARSVIRQYILKRVSPPGACFQPLEDTELMHLPLRMRQFAESDLRLNIVKRAREDLSETFERVIYFANDTRPKDLPLREFLNNMTIENILKAIKTRALKRAFPFEGIATTSIVEMAQSIFTYTYNRWWQDSRWRILRDQLRDGDFRAPQDMQNDLRPLPQVFWDVWDDWRLEQMQEMVDIRLASYLKTVSLTEGPFLGSTYNKQIIVDLFCFTNYAHMDALFQYVTSDRFELVTRDRPLSWFVARYRSWFMPRLISHLSLAHSAPVPKAAYGLLPLDDVARILDPKIRSALRSVSSLDAFKEKYPAAWVFYTESLDKDHTSQKRVMKFYSMDCHCECGNSGNPLCHYKLCALCCGSFDCGEHT